MAFKNLSYFHYFPIAAVCMFLVFKLSDFTAVCSSKDSFLQDIRNG